MYTIVHDAANCKKCKGCRIMLPSMFVANKDGSSLCKQPLFDKRKLKQVIEVAEICCGNCIQYKNNETGEVSTIKGHRRVW